MFQVFRINIASHYLYVCLFSAGANYKLQNQIDMRQNADSETSSKIQQLTKEKDELLELAMQRGKIIQVGLDLFWYSEKATF